MLAQLHMTYVFDLCFVAGSRETKDPGVQIALKRKAVSFVTALRIAEFL
jgi:hypothetical protein